MVVFSTYSRERLGAALVLMTITAGCAPETVHRAPQFPFKDHYATGVGSAPIVVSNTAWWRALNEPTLDRLIDAALVGSPDIALARERITETEALVAAISSPASLESDLQVRHESDLEGSSATIGQASLSFDWLLDPWGSRRAQRKGAMARVEAADAELDAARLLLIQNVANAYIELRYQQRLYTVRRQELTARRQTLGLVRRLFDSDSATRLDVLAAQARLAETEAVLPGIKAAIQVQKYRIAVLVGRAPGDLGIDLDRDAHQPVATLAPNIGIPADMVRNRPDIRIADRLYYAALSDVDQARAALYPSLSLTGMITLSAIDGSGADAYFGPVLSLPALPGSPRKARVAVQESRAQQAMQSWKSTVLDALLEVETSLVNYIGAHGAISASRRSVDLYRQTVTLTRELVTGDGATLRDLVDAEVAVSDAELALAANLRQLALAYVSLNLALGSGSQYGIQTASTGG
ncbi:efflux transporter outer membrane subunit [Frigidibacter sp. ROC022]|uniref:efflux transporter outer membrane subunit n=1 Tax=Frigidibacter sp. ROC022 TaxID=2971796 RepID=UPI00215AE8D5|nr:efflux transporter outer membrane subunit [Frigidibacter sp. ROC022]MCR8726790.1 efflux transporter outer membrane subunit [Frigidibacter sp. ROC022]